LAGLVGSDEDVRRVVASKLGDEPWNVRAAAISALAGLVESDEGVRRAVAAKLDDANTNVSAAAISALAGLVESDEGVRRAVAAKLEDEELFVRISAVVAFAPLIPTDLAIRIRLMTALQTEDVYWSVQKEFTTTRAILARGFGKWLAQDITGWREVTTLIESTDWRLRQSGIEIVTAAGEDAVRQVVPRLLKAMDDHRGYDSWPARIAAAELLLNDLHHSQSAIDTILPALEYGAHPLAFVGNAAEIRQQAALALGKLKADFRRPDVAVKLEELLAKEKSPKVLDGLFNALSSLAAAPEET
jgi:HEAT repeat protein